MSQDHTLNAPSADARAAHRLMRLLKPAPVFAAHLPHDAGREGVERYIATRFHEVHGATVHDFMPVLLTMGCQGAITAATGVRAAGGQPLFLEQYLGGPVERAVSRVARSTIARPDIAEIGNLVATRGGASYLLFMVLTAVLDQAGFRWVVFTATPQVQKAIARLGLHVHGLCPADPARLTQCAAEEWGRYYASRPQVVAGNVAGARALLEDRALCAGALHLFREPIGRLADVVGRGSRGRGTFRLVA